MNQSEKTREILLLHYKKYPKMQIEDLFKFLYQSAFGCEHLVSSLSAACDYIRDEYNTVKDEKTDEITPLDGDYCRVPLSYLNNGLSYQTFGKLFFLSEKRIRGIIHEFESS